ncbi:MAG: DNA translocase FtsK [Armatimonadota bacterium]|nr:DNA translocase FtsK [Armatimonadota bacterium]
MSSRRGRDRSFHSRKPAAGLAVALAGVLLAISYLPGATGIAVVLAVWQRRLFGVAAVAVPACLFLAGMVLVAAGARARFTRRVSGILMAAVSVLMAVHARMVSGDLLAGGQEGAGAGLVGAGLTWAAASLLGRPGMWVIIGILAATGLGLLTGVTTASLGAGLRAAGRGILFLLGWLGEGVLLAVRLVGKGTKRLWAAAGPAAAAGVRAAGRGLVHLRATAAGWMGRLAERGHAAWPRQAMAEPLSVPAGAPAGLGTPPEGPLEAPRPAETGVGDAQPAPAAREPLEGGPEGPRPSPGEPPAQDRRRGAARRSSTKPAPEAGQARLAFEDADYRLPALSVMGDAGTSRTKARIDPADTARALEQTLESFGVKVRVVHWEVGPVVTRFEVQPEPGVRVQKITSLTQDIALNLAAQSVRIEAPIPGKSAVGIEIPNQRASLVHLREILTSEIFQKATSPLVVGIGKDIAGHPIVADLTEMPHLLIAGATGSGKSVALNAMIASLLFRSTPRQVRFVMIDPKRVELTDYNEIPHLLTPVVTNPRQAASVLKDMLRVMEQRFERFAQAGARNIQSYNQLADVEPLYYIVIIIDELADLMMVAPADFEDIICRLAQMTRATGIHLVVATQRPSVDVITGLIKANIPSRLAFAVSSQVDSRVVIDMPGAEKLLGRGDMLFLPLGAARPIRAQGAYIGDDEIRAVVEWWRRQGRPVYDAQLVEAQRSAAPDDAEDSERLIEAARLVVRSGYGSVSLLQRKMRIGYVTAARLIDELEARGVVGPVQGSNPREVLIGLDDLERMLRRKPAAPQ